MSDLLIDWLQTAECQVFICECRENRQAYSGQILRLCRDLQTKSRGILYVAHCDNYQSSKNAD